MPDAVTVRCRENGPLLLPAAAVQIVDHLSNAFTLPAGKEFIALCRCGQTKNRPFCDGSHKTCAFIAADLAPPAVPSGG